MENEMITTKTAPEEKDDSYTNIDCREENGRSNSLYCQWNTELRNGVLSVSEDDLCKSVPDKSLLIILDIEPGILFTAFTACCGMGVRLGIPMRKYSIDTAVNIVRMLKRDRYVVYVCEKPGEGYALVGGYKKVIED